MAIKKTVAAIFIRLHWGQRRFRLIHLDSTHVVLKSGAEDGSLGGVYEISLCKDGGNRGEE